MAKKTSTERAILNVHRDDPEILKQLLADEAERKCRDKKRVKFCPICGKRPEYGFDNAGRHIYTAHCEKCQARFTIHVIE